MIKAFIRTFTDVWFLSKRYNESAGGEEKKSEGEEIWMELFFFILLVGMVLVFGYAQMQKGVFKTPGKITPLDDDEAE